MFITQQVGRLNGLDFNMIFETKTINLQIAEEDKVFTLFTVEGIHDTGKIWDYPPTG